MSAMARNPGTTQSPLRRLLVGAGMLVFSLIGAGYAWTFTPSYSLYRIKQALAAHDYQAFSRYVDTDSVLDHALDEFIDNQDKGVEEHPPRGPLAKALRKGFLKNLARGAREVLKAAVEIAVEQAVKNRADPPPEIPTAAVLGALWYGRADDGTASFPIKVKKGQQIEVKARQTPEGLWRVVAVSNLSAFLPSLKPRHATEPPENG